MDIITTLIQMFGIIIFAYWLIKITMVILNKLV